MIEFISENQIEATVSTSRTFQEMLKIEHGDNAYKKLASTLDMSMPYIDKLAEALGVYLAGRAAKDKFDEQYFNPKYGGFKNFLTRNIYLDPNKKNQMEQARFNSAFMTSLVAETAMKVGARGIQAWAINCDMVKSFGEVYALLNSFANTDTDGANLRGANIELAKIRNSFPLSESQRRSVMKKYSEVLLPENLPTISALSSECGSELGENLAYILYSINAQKFGDNERGRQQLLDYYNLLGYHGNYAQEILRESAASYDTIAGDQTKFLKISRSILGNIAVRIPEINIDRLRAQSDAMAKYDPYSMRRSKVQKAMSGAGTSLAGLFSKRPDLVIQGASTALSQIRLEDNDNVVEFLEKQFHNNGVDSKAFEIILNQSKDISSQANKFDTL